MIVSTASAMMIAWTTTIAAATMAIYATEEMEAETDVIQQ